MTFDEVLGQIQELLQREQRVSYRGLKRRFDLDDEYLEDLKEELIGARRLATDEDGRFLVWAGERSPESSVQSLASEEQRRIGTGRTLDSRLSDPRLDAAERRQLTVMFCDLVGSTALSTQLDPEELREVVRAYQKICTTAIQRYEGHIAQHLGDGLLVYFGYPVAHEDDARRAVQTGLEIIAALAKQVPSPLMGEGQGEGGELPQWQDTPHPHPRPQGARGLQVRVGIHTGLVVIGEIGSSEKREILALGETPNLAARLQGLAEPDTVVISAATYHLVQGLFDCQLLAPQEVKGFPTPLIVHRVLRASEAQSRFEAAATTGLTPLVGREHEMGLLLERWEQAKEGEGQAVLLGGEPGIGKSRLAQELKEQVAKEGAARIEFRCSPYYQNTALYPIIEHLQRLLRFEREEDSHTKLDKLLKALSSYRFPQADTAPLLAALLSLPHPEGYASLTFSPQKQKQKTHEALVAWIMEEAEQQAVYCTWEDLHWADPTTLEILQLYLEQLPATRMLAVLTFRPEFQPPWSHRSYLSQITLSRLGRKHVETMAENITRGKILPAEVVQQIVSKTDGVPLFVEELTKTVIESVGATGRSPLQLEIPATLHDSLMARLDRLNAAKEIVQLGATVGREFSYELFHAVSRLDEEVLQQGLARLIEAELVYQRGTPPRATYLFKHALVQETAYQSLLKSTRQQYHQQIAQVLEEQFPEIKETQPELLAHHYTEAGLVAQAIPYWLKAGERADQRSAYVEAINHLAKGLEVLKILPNTPERSQQELGLQYALGTTLMVTKGYGAPEVERAYARALALCQQLGETPQLVPVLRGLVTFYFTRAELQTARELAEQLLSLAQRLLPLTHPLLVAHLGLGITLFYFGELASALTHIEQSLALYDPQLHRPDRSQFSTADRKVVGLCYAARILWDLGYPDQARQRMNEALTVARKLSHPFSVAFALSNATGLYQSLREVRVVQEHAEALMTLAREHGFAFFLAGKAMRQVWILAEQGQAEEGIAQMRQDRPAFRATGAKVESLRSLAYLAAAHGKVGQREEGLMVLAEALALVNKTEARENEAELYRLKGQLTLQSQVESHKSKVEEAEEYFLKAIEIACKQQAKSLELRAVMSLARLWRQQGKKEKAHEMLSEIYGWFTEGFDTKDLQEAKTLLEELTH